MLNKHLYTLCLCLFSVCLLFSQKEKDSANIGLDKDLVQINQSIVETTPIDPLSPSRAAFYSAILPGLGQAYNKKYWKIPIVWGAIGTGVYFYVRNDKQFDRFRDAYKRRLAGFTDDEFYGDGGLRMDFVKRPEMALTYGYINSSLPLSTFWENFIAGFLGFFVDQFTWKTIGKNAKPCRLF